MINRSTRLKSMSFIKFKIGKVPIKLINGAPTVFKIKNTEIPMKNNGMNLFGLFFFDIVKSPKIEKNKPSVPT